MRIFITHNNFPAQFRHIIEHLGRDQNNQVVFATKTNDLDGISLEFVKSNSCLRENVRQQRTTYASSRTMLCYTERDCWVSAVD